MKRLEVLLSVVAFVMATGLGVKAATLRVPEDYSTIQAGIDAASNGDTVMAEPGRYAPSENGEEFPIVLKSDVVVISSAGSYSTIVDAEGTGGGFTGENISNCVVSGFTVTGGQAFKGGGMYIASSTGITIKGCNFTGNTATFGGGALHLREGQDMLIEDNFISKNTAWNCGGADLAFNTSTVFRRNIVIQNSSTNHGGGIMVYSGDDLVVNNTVVGNITTGDGGGIIPVYYCKPTLLNNIIVHNEAGGEGGGISFREGASALISYNDVWANSTDYGGGAEPGEGDISADPLFQGDEPFSYALIANSPCIDAGDPSSPLDPDGTRADMGALYFDQRYLIEATVELEPNEWNLNWAKPGNPWGKGTVDCFIGNGGELTTIRVWQLLKEQTEFGPFQVVELGTKGKWLKRVKWVKFKYTGQTATVVAWNLGNILFEGTVESGSQFRVEAKPRRCILGQLFLTVGTEAFEAGDIALGFILLEGTVPPREYNGQTYFKILPHVPGFMGEVLKVKFKKSKPVAALGEVLPGDIVQVTVTGCFETGESFEGTDEITIVKRWLGKPVAELQSSAPSSYSLSQNYPNPFNAQTTIRYGMATTGAVRLSIYGLTGQRVRTLLDGDRPAGSYLVVWDGRDDTGRDVASGVYLYRLEVQGQYVQSKRMVLLR